MLKRVVDVAPKYAMCNVLYYFYSDFKGAFRFGMEKGRPAIVKFSNYARVELRPPKVSELTPALEEGKSILNFFKSGAWKQKTVKVCSQNCLSFCLGIRPRWCCCCRSANVVLRW